MNYFRGAPGRERHSAFPYETSGNQGRGGK